MIAMGQRWPEPSGEEATRTAALWGPNPVHPTSAAYMMTTESLNGDIQNGEARYTNRPRAQRVPPKRPKYDPSLEMAGWVSGCSAVVPRRDAVQPRGNPDHAPRGLNRAGRMRGHSVRGHYHSFCGDFKQDGRGSGNYCCCRMGRGKRF
jgi:hypothetical protein